MRCPGCGFVTFDGAPACKGCGRALEPRPTSSPGRPARAIEEVRAPLLSGAPSGIRRPPEASLAKGGRRTSRWVPSAGRESAGPPDAGVALAEAEDLRAVPPSPPAEVELSPPRPAGFWVRYRAFLIDAIILVGLGLVGDWLVREVVQLGGRVGGALDFELEGLAFWGSLGFGLVTHGVCHTVFVGWRGQTPGKMLTRIKIVRVDASPVGFAWAFARWLAWLTSGLAFGLGYLPIPFSRSKRGLHDRLVGTMVIRLPRRKRRP